MNLYLSLFGRAYRRYEGEISFGIMEQDRLSHVYIIGQTGTGKSTLLSNLAWQDAYNRIGFCLVDPHGDLAASLHHNLEKRHLYWDVADPECRLGYNPLKRVSEQYRPLVVSALIETLKKQWPDAWGARMKHCFVMQLLRCWNSPRLIFEIL